MNTRMSAVLIGRNEGARLIACLASLGDGFCRVVYVDSGSTDGSVEAARAAGAEVVALDTTIPFTAARARNAGIAMLKNGDIPTYVQFLDGDCTLVPHWTTAGATFLDAHPEVAVVCGRLRERSPEASVYNRLCDAEWDTPTGEALACGGIALIRWDALDAVNGYNADLIAGEEPEMCLRMRRLGWKIWRLDSEMALHDAAMTRFGQFWARARRSGFATAEGAAMYGRDPEKHGVAPLRRAIFWAAILPAIIALGACFIGSTALWALVIYPLQVTRLALRTGGTRTSWIIAFFMTVGKFAEFSGACAYVWRRWQGTKPALIEYK